MYSVGVIQGQEAVEDEPMLTEDAAITLAYDRSIESDECHCVLTGPGDNQTVLYVVWGGHIFKKHDL